MAPPVIIDDPAGHHRPPVLQTLADHLQAELIKAGERSQVSTREGSVGHVEVFRVDGVGTSIIGRPRPSPPHRRADHTQPRPYTLICEEPVLYYELCFHKLM